MICHKWNQNHRCFKKKQSSTHFDSFSTVDNDTWSHFGDFGWHFLSRCQNAFLFSPIWHCIRALSKSWYRCSPVTCILFNEIMSLLFLFCRSAILRGCEIFKWRVRGRESNAWKHGAFCFLTANRDKVEIWPQHWLKSKTDPAGGGRVWGGLRKWREREGEEREGWR